VCGGCGKAQHVLASGSGSTNARRLARTRTARPDCKKINVSLVYRDVWTNSQGRGNAPFWYEYIAMYGQTVRGNSPFWYEYGQSVGGMWLLGNTYQGKKVQRHALRGVCHATCDQPNHHPVAVPVVRLPEPRAGNERVVGKRDRSGHTGDG
jgi:hypothetical protein